MEKQRSQVQDHIEQMRITQASQNEKLYKLFELAKSTLTNASNGNVPHSDAIGSTAEGSAPFVSASLTAAARDVKRDISAFAMTATAATAAPATSSSKDINNGNGNISSSGSSSNSNSTRVHDTADLHGLRKRPEPFTLQDDPKKRRICLPSISEVMAAHAAPGPPADSHRPTTAHFDSRR
ncbi:hypothetical protein BCR43DRAFT_499748 [Syncephalastrum racemosum]|uniref:Uncharacterized protein n=1 Tax=Syncephalastrum racemosum TaxID=13706 RepID=A0A1X2H0R4_SYNRA|nr:hypothetical protein BCR43DRAFT_499748 [Syncephalastrum racemosum]